MAITVRSLFRNVNRTFCHSTSKHINSNSDTRESNNGEIKDWKVELYDTMKVLLNFISEKEEDVLIQEVDPYMQRLRYEYSHWDNVGKMNLIKSLRFDIWIVSSSIFDTLNLLRRRYMAIEKPNGRSGAKIARGFSTKFVEKRSHQKRCISRTCIY